MLKSIWNKAVYGVQYLNQMRDGNALQVCDNEIKDAKDGFRTAVVGHTYGAHLVKIELTPAQAKDIIEAASVRRAEIMHEMEQRRKTYGLKF
jgi:hypothetical protein